MSHSTEAKTKAKSVLAILERLSGSSNPDKDQTRYLCHRLLQLVNEQESAKKDVGSKAGLDIILLTLESCSDQATCLALVSTLAEIAHGGGGAIKRLISHDATRVLLHTLSYIGAELDWRLLSGIIHLLAKLGPKDRRFALRARLTGSLSMLLNAVRSSHNHTSHARLLPIALLVLKTSIFNSSTNATLLGRGGAVNVLYRIVISLTRKQVLPLKNALATFNLLVRLSRANVNRAVKLGAVPQLLGMHQDYHKHDFKHNRHSAIRKSILNSIKNIAGLKNGRKAFSDANGLMILYKSCHDYLEASASNKSLESFLTVAIIIIRRCQPKSRLPIANSRCSFHFPLEGGRERSDSIDSCNLFDESDDDFEDNDEILSNDELDDGGEATPSKRRGSGNSVSKSSGTSENLKESNKLKPVLRSSADLKMYETFFPELLDFPVPSESYSLDADSTDRPHTSGEADCLTPSRMHENRHSLPDLTHIGCGRPGYRLQEVARRMLALNFGPLDINDASQKEIFGAMGAENSFDKEQLMKSRADPVNYSSGDDTKFRAQDRYYSPLQRKAIIRDETCLQFSLSSDSARQDYRLPQCADDISNSGLSLESTQMMGKIQQFAGQTKSAKEAINRLSSADAWGCLGNSKIEPQANKKHVQRLIKSKVLEDVARVLFPDTVIKKLVYSSDVKIYDKDSLPKLENGQLCACDVHPPSEPSKNNDISSKICTNVCNGDRLGSGFRLRENNAHLPAERIVVTVPRHEAQSSTSTSISDDTWPGVYLEKENLDTKNNDLSSKNVSSVNNLKTPPLPCLERRSSLETTPTLKFDSRFESGNLRAAFHIREFEYDLVLNPDCNSNHHFQWFYFEISRMKASQPYRFNIINCEKKGSVVNEGMQPVMFSMVEAMLGRPHWVRIGRETCYYRNHFLRNHASAGGVKGRTYFTLTFTVTFRHPDDTCFFAYHYPYTYTKLQLDLRNFMRNVDHNTIYVRNQTFCHTLSGNEVPLLTITAPPRPDESSSEKETIEEMKSRPYIFLTARVHPGESNASWTMRGTLQLLLTPPPTGSDPEEDTIAAVADELRRSYIFKVVPMLNPDGVINGHHRCSLSGEDLNRTWSDPIPTLFPTIYHTKGLLQYLQMIKKPPLVYCDYHGHSRRMNVFLYGCSHRESIAAGESNSVSDGPEDQGCKTLPKLLDHFAAPFALKNCSFVVEKSKLSTARVVVWKEMGVTRSYTMESTYCGCDQGPLRGKQIGTRDLEEMGSKFCEVMLHMKAKSNRGLPVYNSDDETGNKQETASKSSKDGQRERGGPVCPANSDAELTPDEDVWTLDEAYGVYMEQTDEPNQTSFRYLLDKRHQSFSSITDYSFWRYEESSFSQDDPKRPLTSSDLSDLVSDPSTTTLDDDSSLDIETTLTSRNPSHAKPTPLISGRISPATGRVVEYDQEEIATTAPRPFESGLVLKKSHRDSDPFMDPLSCLPCSSSSKIETKTARVRRRLSRQSKEKP